MDWGAWQLRFNWYRAQGYSFSDYQVGQTDSFADYTGAYNVTYGNRATSALYRYTPHVFNGNYNFWRYYQNFFDPIVVLNVSPGGKVKIIVGGTTRECSETCYLQYPNGTTLDYQAVNSSDALFSSWTGCDSSIAKCGFLFSDGKTVTANTTPEILLN